MGFRKEINFSQVQLESIFPFYFEIDRNLVIRSTGPSFKKLFGQLNGQNISSKFHFQRPLLESKSFESIQKKINEVFIIQSIDNGVLTRGQFLVLDSDSSLIFIGSPWIQNIESLQESNLFFTDFAIHDPTFDLLHIIKNIEINSDEIKQLLLKLNEKTALLKRSEEEYRATLNVASDIIYKTNTEGKFTYINPAGERVTEYSVQELIDMHYLDLIREDYREKARQQYKDQLDTQTPSSYYEFPIITKFGKEKWIGQSVQILKVENTIQVVALAIDITSQKSNEFALIESKNQLELLQSLIDNSSDAIQIAEEDGKLYYINQIAEERLGINKNECSKYNVSDFETFFKDKANWIKHLEELKEKSQLILEGENIHQRTKLKFPVEVTVKYIKIGDKGYVIANSRDITARKNAEFQLALQEEKFRNIIANMNLGLLEVDMNELILFANQSFCDMSGYTLEELKGKKASAIFIKNLSENDINENIRKREEGISDGYEVEVYNKIGQERWWFVSGAPNYNDKGKHIGSIGIHLDITDQKRLELELAKAKDTAEEASKAKEYFLANMSHEIRTPLNVIIGMIRELNKEKLNEQQFLYVKQSESSARHLLTILNNILDISKIESGELELMNRDFSVNAMAYNVRSILNSQCVEKGLEFNLKINPDIEVALIGDEVRIRQVLINLVGNSIKFTNKGHINLTIELIHNSDLSQQILFEIEDSGIGMSEDFIARIFDKFSQEEDTTNRRFEGTGLGMAISNDLVKLMGSELKVLSIKDKGTTIQFELHLPKGSVANLYNAGVEIKKNKLKGTRVLLVEDNEMNRFIARQSLEYAGCTITEAENGQEAIGKLKEYNFDLILMDIQMPIMDGVEASIYIRNKLKLEVPIIALTANAFKHDIDRYLSIGMNDFVTKPYDEQEFLRKVDHAVKSFSLSALNLKNDSIEKTRLYNLDFLNQMSKGNDEFVNKMLTIFCKLAEENIELIHQGLKEKDIIQLNKIAHKIKPSIDQMGIESIKETVRKLEKYNEIDAQLTEMCLTIISTLRKVVDDINLID